MKQEEKLLETQETKKVSGPKKEENSLKKTVSKDKPRKKCNDKKCPICGNNVKLRGRTFIGTVYGGDVHRTAKVEWERMFYLHKYERKERRRTRVKAHNPECVNAQTGDKVKIMECKPLSKTKKFVIINKMGAKK